jgi:hypothetical protein
VARKVARLESIINPIGDDSTQILKHQSSALESTHIGSLLNINYKSDTESWFLQLHLSSLNSYVTLSTHSS